MNSLKVDMHYAVMAGCTSQMYEILIDGQNKILINILKNRKTCSVSSLLSFNILSTLFFNSFSFFSACWKNLDPLLVSRIILFIRSLSNPAFEWCVIYLVRPGFDLLCESFLSLYIGRTVSILMHPHKFLNFKQPN